MRLFSHRLMVLSFRHTPFHSCHEGALGAGIDIRQALLLYSSYTHKTLFCI